MKSDIEIAVESSKQLEAALKSRNATGKGLHEMIGSIEHSLDPSLVRDLRSIASARNRVVHEVGSSQLDDRQQFESKVATAVRKINGSHQAPSTKIEDAWALVGVVAVGVIFWPVLKALNDLSTRLHERGLWWWSLGGFLLCAFFLRAAALRAAAVLSAALRNRQKKQPCRKLVLDSSNTWDIKSLTANKAKELAERRGDLYLDGLIALSEDVAKALAKHKSRLSLNGLITLSDEAAGALAKHEGDYLYLNGLTTLSEDAARALAQHKGSLYLNGLTRLSEEAANALKGNADVSLPDIFER